MRTKTEAPSTKIRRDPASADAVSSAEPGVLDSVMSNADTSCSVATHDAALPPPSEVAAFGSSVINDNGAPSPAALDAPVAGRPRGSLRLRAGLVGADLCFAASAWFLAAVTPVGNRQPSVACAVATLPGWIIAIGLAFHMAKLYLARVCAVRALEVSRVTSAVAGASAALLLVHEQIAVRGVSTGRHLLAVLYGLVLVNLGRAIYRGQLRQARKAGLHARRVVIVGTGEEGAHLHDLLAQSPELGYQVVGVVGERSEALASSFTVPYLGEVVEVVDAARSVGASGVLVATSSVDFRLLNLIVRELLDADLHIQISGGLSGFAANRLRSNPLGREAAFYLEHVSLTGWQTGVKRVLDLVIGSILLVLTLPIMAVAALFVKLHDRGPVLFKQQRIGRDGQPFMVWKLRTMIVNADKKLEELLKHNERTGPLFKMKNDPRFTPIGRILDATSINELPQLFNVLRGHMSLVGPRPALAREVANFSDRLLTRHRVKPGITGLWQVEGRESPSFESYERCDVFYVENWSVGLDLAILGQTAGEVLRRAAGFGRSDDADEEDGDEMVTEIGLSLARQGSAGSGAAHPVG